MRPGFFLPIAFCLLPFFSFSQCCSAGSGSPIAGGSSQGVLEQRQMELNTNYQYIFTRKFYKEDRPDSAFLDKYQSHYNYFRIAYGLNKQLTLSLETGYYFEKMQVTLDSQKIGSSGIADLIIFPRYNVYSKTEENRKVDLTLGLGWKIPLGKYNDSIGELEPFSGNIFYYTMPPAVQPTTGSNDFIFYAFYFREFTPKKFRVFSNALYIRKGWNPNGEKFGDYASIGLFASKTVLKKLGLVLQLKGEWIDKMKFNEDVYLMGSLNYDPLATGSKKVFVVPQVSYTFKSKVILYALTEIPVYQYVNESQIGSQFQLTAGLSYRFYVKKKAEK